jgi:hypothetical protein
MAIEDVWMLNTSKMWQIVAHRRFGEQIFFLLHTMCQDFTPFLYFFSKASVADSSVLTAKQLL